MGSGEEIDNVAFAESNGIVNVVRTWQVLNGNRDHRRHT